MPRLPITSARAAQLSATVSTLAYRIYFGSQFSFLISPAFALWRLFSDWPGKGENVSHGYAYIRQRGHVLP